MLLYAVPQLQLRHRSAAMLAAFIPYGTVAWAVASLIFLTAGRRWLKVMALPAAACLIVQVMWAKPYWPHHAQTELGTLTVMTFNLRCNPVNLADLTAEVRRTQPSVVVLQDVAQKEQDALQQASWPLPHRAALAAHPGASTSASATCRTVVYSAGPLSQVASSETPAPRLATLRADLPSGPLTVIPVDVANPSAGLNAWANDLAAVHQAVVAQGDHPLIVIGDFNATLEHLPMRRLRQRGLADAAEQSGAGWLPTFRALGRVPVIAIDHVLLSNSLTAVSVETFSVSGAEHLGLVAHLRLDRR